MISTCFNYAGHTVYDDGRLYQSHELIGQYASASAAKSVATKRAKAQRAEAAAEHHAAILNIWSKKA